MPHRPKLTLRRVLSPVAVAAALAMLLPLRKALGDASTGATSSPLLGLTNARGKIDPERVALAARRLTRAKQPKRFAHFGKNVRSRLDASTSTTNRRKRLTGADFHGATERGL